ncbi:class I SAM-dependent methyltransferase [Streptomyces radicis]|uniref:Class I SAM-dependent methyltransferase n=1 Tax=Streptomyces radicis TaxID=1750517 RepID=A0A3A9WFP2_9ACTN|nr:class I SAM-dependent methyltransferase [Streptomyces radicis]RKN06496.1 class I SAM-dependent methyltransferase [Streptomyces radicis]RKN20245.1 class I SAM-dependent methyltransferase [Streptomyces radicis]
MTDWQGWQESWDRQQEWYMPDREDRFRVMLDAVEAFVGDKPRVLDLACGTGSITRRLLRRFPEARSTGVDLDPALLAIARGTFDGDERVSFVSADLTEPDWADALPHVPYDAVLTSTALHWLDGRALVTLYGQLAGLVRPGGILLNADHMPDDSTPLITAAERAFTKARQERERAGGVADWAEWWRSVADSPELGELARERFRLIGDPTAGDHSEGEVHPVGWHAETLRAAGFAEARAAWVSLTDAVILALR